MTSLASLAAALPDVDGLRNLVRARAVVEVCRSAPTRWGRDDSFEVRPDGDEVYVSRNGAGDEWSVTFAPLGALLRVFSHESEISPYALEPMRLVDGLLDGLPDGLLPAVFDPAFDAGFGEGYLGVPAATLFLWRERSADTWSHGSTVFPGDANEGLWLLPTAFTPAELAAELSDGYGVPVPAGALEHLLAGRPLTQAVCDLLGGRPLEDVLTETVPMGYPT